MYELIREITSNQLKLTPAKSKSVTEAPRGGFAQKVHKYKAKSVALPSSLSVGHKL